MTGAMNNFQRKLKFLHQEGKHKYMEEYESFIETLKPRIKSALEEAAADGWSYIYMNELIVRLDIPERHRIRSKHSIEVFIRDYIKNELEIDHYTPKGLSKSYFTWVK